MGQQEHTFTDDEVQAITKARFAVEAGNAGWPVEERPKLTKEEIATARFALDRLAREGRAD